MRYFIELSYNGKNYHGWQIQPDAVSVQEVLEKAISTLLRSEIKITGAGRTDTGVHAKQIFAHFDAEGIEDLNHFRFRLNAFLPKDIAIHRIFRVKEEAHARFHATEREYKYYLALQKDPFWEGFAYFVHQKPDVDLMNEAAQVLLDYRDFQCFSRSKTDVKTYHCDIIMASWESNEDQLIFTIRADRFLRNMVRAIVGTLLEVGYGKMTLEEFHEVIQSKDRGKAGASAPATGLYLTQVVYPEDIKL
ncbi:tRNA pseudouridine(38-40) synthase TruA [Aureisphaera galaxeae]|uniref:tRNA pseudouridine(38-40) synthase TruA n=1 Tax=Aureisphaera galaxeae TaxID=1538023 RepID=UPI00235073DC|nr:tRNA pseudouridine(38-40) synthase TruA [Aureisphaera galaxeae]MDC8006140.1 tRNA pseudouridine(38-40) synthase TruA [Aureisphaera galaxeae]